LPAITATLTEAGFIPDEVLGVAMFLDGPNAKPVSRSICFSAGKRPGPII
jgi:hypothetical protein